MTYPQQYAQPQAPGYPPAPEQQYAQPQGQFPQPAQPQYPQAPAPQPPQPQYAPAQGYAPAPGYPAPPQQYAPPAGYPQPYAPPQAPGYPQQPAPQLATGSLDAYYSQPSVGGGAALKFDVGTTHVGVVARPITNADIQQQTIVNTNQPAFFKDGRPKFVMKVPLQVQPSQVHPDGNAQWYCAGSARDELSRAMSEAGAPEGPPEAGATIEITCTGLRQVPGINPAKVYRVRYARPGNALGQPATAVQQQVPAPQAAPMQPPVQQIPQPPVAMPVPPQAAPVQQSPMPPVPPAAPGNLSPEQQQLLAQLTGQAAGQPTG